MNGPEHYYEAEQCANYAREAWDADRFEEVAFWQRQAQIHATLAQAAASADLGVVEGPGGGRTSNDGYEWERVLWPERAADRSRQAAQDPALPPEPTLPDFVARHQHASDGDTPQLG
jgi:hypothetical protein